MKKVEIGNGIEDILLHNTHPQSLMLAQYSSTVYDPLVKIEEEAIAKTCSIYS